MTQHCTHCETLKDNIANLEMMIATLEQEARQQHARNVRINEELDYAMKLIGELREAAAVMPLSYSQIRESFLR